MRLFTAFKQSNKYVRSRGVFGLTFTFVLMLTTAVFAQPAIPTLSLPDSAAINQSIKLRLVWNQTVDAQTYRLQISENASFSTSVFDNSQLTDTTKIVDILKLSTNYFWRVAATNKAGTSQFSKVYSFTTWASAPKVPEPVTLGSLTKFAILAYSAVTNIPTSAIKGDVGLTPTAGSFIGLTQGEVTGTIFTVDVSGPAGSVESAVMLTVAKGDLTIAYNDAAGRTIAPVGIAGNIGGQTLFPGLYKSTGSLEISAGDLTLDGNGNEDGVWIFQIASTFNMTADRKVFLTNGAKPGNIFWQVGTAAIMGSTVVMKGTIMAGTQITFGTGATLDGRALALTENVTLQQNTINVPDPSTGTAIEIDESGLPTTIMLSQNYPNPFNPSTSIRFGINTSSKVQLEVFNMLGQRVATLLNEQKAAGWYTVNFDASRLTSGTYIYRINANGSQQNKKMTLIK